MFVFGLFSLRNDVKSRYLPIIYGGFYVFMWFYKVPPDRTKYFSFLLGHRLRVERLMDGQGTALFEMGRGV